MKTKIQKIALVSAILLGSGLSSFLAQASDCVKKRVMLTAFEPWSGRAQNGSEVVASSILKQRLGGDDIDYSLCLLPVEYDRASRKAEECIENIKPDVVISLGESSCDIEVEVRAHNLDNDSDPNNAGVIHKNRVITPGAPPEEFLTLPVLDMICATNTAVAPQTLPSVSPGNYVCNNTAYHLAEYLRPKQIPFGFIHVPMASCSVDMTGVAKKLHVMTRVAIRSLGLSTSVFAQKNPRLSGPSCAVDRLAPVTAACREQTRKKIRFMYGH